MLIKVCGMREADNICEIDNIAGIDWMGFIFYPKSKRFVNAKPGYLPHQSKRVGVFVNETIDAILAKCNEYGLDAVQLHGDENPDFCSRLRKLLPQNVLLVKALQIADKTDLAMVALYDGIADYFLFETKCVGYGGSGEQFDWQILEEYDGNVPFLLTGGIGATDADRIKEFRHPKFAGIDINSRFEISPANKDAQAIKTFIEKLNK